MTSSIADEVFNLGWIIEDENKYRVSKEIDESLSDLYHKIEENPVWKERFITCFKQPGMPFRSYKDLQIFSISFSFGAKSNLPAELRELLRYWAWDENSPLAQIVKEKYWSYRGQILKLALYNHFILKN